MRRPVHPLPRFAAFALTVGLVHVLGAPPAVALDVPLPPRSGGLLHCVAGRTCAAEARALLSTTGAHTAALAFAKHAAEVRATTGLSLLEPERLVAEGVAPEASWTQFDRDGGTFLVVTVTDPAAFAKAMAAWATARTLPHAEPISEKGSTGALYARTAATRPAAGWLLRRELAVVMLRPATRKALLEAAAAFDRAVPVSAPVSGAFVTWERGGSRLPAMAPKETWTGLRLSASGVEATVRLSGLVADTFGGADAAWIGETFRTGGAGVRLRAVLGASGASALAAEVAERLPFTSREHQRAWATAWASAAVGRVEVTIPAIAASAIDLEDDSPDLLRLGPPWIALPDRAETNALFTRSIRTLRLPMARGDTLRVGGKDAPATIAKAGATFAVGLGVHGKIPDSLPISASVPSCAKGAPVAAVRLDAPLLAAGLDEVSVFSALGGGGALGAYAAGAEFGSLLRATSHAEALACRIAESTVVIEARWRLSAR